MGGFLPRRQLVVLRVLRGGGVWRQKDVVGVCGLRQPQVSLALGELVALGLVVRVGGGWCLGGSWEWVLGRVRGWFLGELEGVVAWLNEGI